MKTGTKTVVIRHGDVVHLGEFTVEADFGEGNRVELTADEFDEMRRDLVKEVRKQLMAGRVLERACRTSQNWVQRLTRQLDESTGLLTK